MSVTLFNGEQPITATNASDGAPGLTLATLITCNVNGDIDAVGWRFPDELPSSPVEYYLVSYDLATDLPTGSLASGVFSSPVAGQYNWATFAPISRLAGQRVCAEIWTSNRYVATNGYFASAAKTNADGSLTGPQDDNVAPISRNGRFRSGNTAAFPSQGSGASYFVDIRFTPAITQVDGTLQATAPPGVFASTATVIDLGALASTAPSPVLEAAGFVIVSGGMAASAPAASLSAAGVLINSGSMQATAPAAVFSATNIVPRTAVLTPGGSNASALTPGGSAASTLTASGF